MQKTIWALILAAALVFGLATPAWANKWTRPEDNPAPSLYAGREYTRQHWVDFYFDEHGTSGASINRARASLLFSGHCSVFDIKGSYDRGYTAVGDRDGVAFTAAFTLAALGVPLVDGYWIVSPAFWRDRHGAAPSIFGGSEMIRDVRIDSVRSSEGLTPGFNTIDNPKCFRNDSGGFRAGGYHGQTPYHWYSIGEKSPAALTRQYASNAGTLVVGGGSVFTTRAEICFNYIYGLTVAPASLMPVGSPADGKQTWVVSAYNTAPFVAKNVKLRAYIVRDGKYTLARETTTDLPPLPVLWPNGRAPVTATVQLGSGVTQTEVPNTVRWTFEAPAPSGSYEVLVTANVRVDENGRASAEPLTTEVAYGNSGARNAYPLTGTKEEKAAGLPASSFGGLPVPYSDNWIRSGQLLGWQPPGGGGGTQPTLPNDLAVTIVETLDAETGQPVTSPRANQAIRIRAQFNSTFDVGGWARIRLYRYQEEFKRLDESDRRNVYFAPKATHTAEWTTTIGEGKYQFIATICLYNTTNNPGGEWQPEKFDGKYDEATYTNNRMSADLTGQHVVYIPQPRETSESAWYPPLTWKETPIYEPVTEPVYGWKKVRFTREEAQGTVRVRLVE